MTDKLISWEAAVSWLKTQSDQQELVRACFYDDPLITAAERFYTSTEWCAVKQIVERFTKGNVLDIGAGRGISSYAFARDGWTVTALEPDPGEIVGAGAIRSLAIEEELEITVVESWGEELPFIDGSFDLVYARQALHHARDLDALCREIYRVLRPGGVLLATREHVISKPEDRAVFLASHPLHGLYGGENAYVVDRYRTAITHSGITLLQVLAAYDSNINIYPGTIAELKEKIEKRLKLPIPYILFIKVIVPLLNLVNSEQGRLYTFLGQKP